MNDFFLDRDWQNDPLTDIVEKFLSPSQAVSWMRHKSIIVNENEFEKIEEIFHFSPLDLNFLRGWRST